MFFSPSMSHLHTRKASVSIIYHFSYAFMWRSVAMHGAEDPYLKTNLVAFYHLTVDTSIADFLYRRSCLSRKCLLCQWEPLPVFTAFISFPKGLLPLVQLIFSLASFPLNSNNSTIVHDGHNLSFSHTHTHAPTHDLAGSAFILIPLEAYSDMLCYDIKMHTVAHSVDFTIGFLCWPDLQQCEECSNNIIGSIINGCIIGLFDFPAGIFPPNEMRHAVVEVFK